MFVFIICPDAQSVAVLLVLRRSLRSEMLLTELNVKQWPFGKLNALCLLGGEL